MLRKILIAGIASFACLSPLAVSAASPMAHHPVRHHHHHHHHRYAVYFRSCSGEAWRYSSSYRFRGDAVYAARALRAQGFEAYVR